MLIGLVLLDRGKKVEKEDGIGVSEVLEKYGLLEKDRVIE